MYYHSSPARTYLAHDVDPAFMTPVQIFGVTSFLAVRTCHALLPGSTSNVICCTLAHCSSFPQCRGPGFLVLAVLGFGFRNFVGPHSIMCSSFLCELRWLASRLISSVAPSAPDIAHACARVFTRAEMIQAACYMRLAAECRTPLSSMRRSLFKRGSAWKRASTLVIGLVPSPMDLRMFIWR